MDTNKPTVASIAYVSCPNCRSDKAVVAATTYHEQLCFCPACEHVWDCPTPEPKPDVSSPPSAS